MKVHILFDVNRHIHKSYKYYTNVFRSGTEVSWFIFKSYFSGNISLKGTLRKNRFVMFKKIAPSASSRADFRSLKISGQFSFRKEFVLGPKKKRDI